MKREPFRILSLVMEQPWAITDRALETILTVLERPASDLEAVAARIGRPLDNTGNSVEMRGGTAIMSIEGPIFRYANLFTMISGATSVEMLAQDLETAASDPHVDRILLNVNSPGGQVDGINELADQIRAANTRKPVIAYVDGLAASAAYWLSAAAGRIVANESAFIGSIGVVAAMADSRAADEKRGVKRYEIVSSQSPRKRPDPATENGRAQILEQVDAIAALFIERVAGFRKVSTDTVLEKFGRGGVLPARLAMSAGMIDSLGSFETLLQDLNQTTAAGSRFLAAATQEEQMPADPAATTTAAPTTTPNREPINTERTRIAAILSLPEAQGREALARTLALETDHDPETVRRILVSAPVQSAAPVNPLAEAMEQVPNPKVGVGNTDAKDDAAAEAASVLAFVPKRFLRSA